MKTTKLTYEQALLELAQIIEQMEDNETPIEQLIASTARANELIAYCEGILFDVKNKLAANKAKDDL
jgi:exodeoxyribonuclease VII small subunit